MEDAKAAQDKNMSAQEQARMQEQIKQAAAQLLEPNAYSRLMLIAQSNPQLFTKALQSIAYLAQAGRLQGRMNDEQLKKLLLRLLPQEKETKITFARKGE
ncbi:MAG: DNA-binding protein [Candidatus Micrarchaeia archaeon]